MVCRILIVDIIKDAVKVVQSFRSDYEGQMYIINKDVTIVLDILIEQLISSTNALTRFIFSSLCRDNKLSRDHGSNVTITNDWEVN